MRVRIGLSIALIGWLGLVTPYPIDAIALGLGWRTSLIAVGSIWSFAPELIFFASLLVVSIGLWVATAHEPRLRNFDTMDETRGVVRFLFGLSFAFLFPGGLFGEPVLFLIGFVCFPFLVLFALKWAYELAARPPIERRPLGRVFLWLPIVAIAIAVLAMATRYWVFSAVGLVAAFTAWATTAYVIQRALAAVSSAVKTLRDRERAMSCAAES